MGGRLCRAPDFRLGRPGEACDENAFDALPGREEVVMPLSSTLASGSVLGVLGIAVGIAFVPRETTGSALVDLKVLLSVEREGRAQLYYDLDGNGFSEAQSQLVPLEAFGKPVPHYWPLPPGTYHALRIDPVDHDGAFAIHGAWILSGEGAGEVVWKFDAADFVPLANVAETRIEGDVLYVTPEPGTSDPSLGIQLPDSLTLPVEERGWLLPGTTRLVVLWAAAGLATIVHLGLGRLNPPAARGTRGPVLGRGLIRIGLLAVIAAPVLAPMGGEKVPRYVLQTQLLSPQPGNVDVFYDETGRGISPEQVLRDFVPASSNPVRLRFVLPAAPLHALRLDPIDVAVPVRMSPPRILGPDGSVVHVFAFEDIVSTHGVERLKQEGASWFVEPTGADPYFYLRVPAFLESRRTVDARSVLDRLRFAWPVVAALLAVNVVLGFYRNRGRPAVAPA